MASYGYTFNSGDGVTPARLNAARTVSEIVNADISATAAIAYSKLNLASSVAVADLAAAVANALIPAGSVQAFARSTAPTGWLAANGNTIGSASSGANNASADYSALFAVLWDNWSNTDLPILDSAGAASTRGASAAADFSANKRLPLPDLRGIFIRGSGSQTIAGTSYAGTFAAKNADALKTHTHSVSGNTGDDSPDHAHAGYTDTQGAHSHNTYAFRSSRTFASGSRLTVDGLYYPGSGPNDTGGTDTQGSHSHNIQTYGAQQRHQHSVSLTSGNPSTGTSTETRPANIALLYCIKF